jgi:mono/diheme cytochrome c family protein
MRSARPFSLRSLRWIAFVLVAFTQEPRRPEAAAPRAPQLNDPWNAFPTDFPFQASPLAVVRPRGNTVNKAISIRLAHGAAIAFDTDLLRMAAGWTGGFISPNGLPWTTKHGEYPAVVGEQVFGTRPTPGWGDARGRLDDPRGSEPYGPLPQRWGRWGGVHVVGNDVVLSYTVLGVPVHEHPSAISHDGEVALARTLSVGRRTRALTMVVGDVEQAQGEQPLKDASGLFVDEPQDMATAVVAVGAPTRTVVKRTPAGRLLLQLPAGDPALFKVVIWRGPRARRDRLPSLLAGAPKMPTFAQGGPARWKQSVVTKGVLGKGPGPYVIDRLTTPFAGTYYDGKIPSWGDNVYKRRIMIGGFDFFADGKRAALATWEGDVWMVSGIEGDLSRLTWRRFASGGHGTLGLKIVNDVIYTSGRDQITRYHDTNGDGEADFYENFNNQVASSVGFHEFQFDLHTNAQGNFYTSKAGPVRAGGSGFGGGGGNGEITRHAGTIQMISPDGRRLKIYARGLRAPNGIGVSPNGQVTAGDNEGTWMPACPIHWVQPNSFHGVESLVPGKRAPRMQPPLCWISKTYDNSGGSQIWVTSDKWGPFQGELLHLSYGRAAIYLVLKEKVAGLMQGGIVRMIGGSDAAQFTGDAQKLTSSAMRARFNPVDGQLYVAGLAGWQTDAVAVTGFDRVRYVGSPVHTVRDLKVTSAGVALTFSHPLDPATVSPQNFSGERWNYARTSSYGSPEFSVTEPQRRGHDRLEIVGTRLSDDQRTVTLEISDLRPVHQMLLKWKVKAQDGTSIKQSLMHTVHVVPRDPKARKIERVVRRGKPGLELTISGADGRVGEVRDTPDVSLYVSAGQTASPFLPAGAFRAVWEGTLAPELAGEYQFQADVRGTLKLEVNGAEVLSAGQASQATSSTVKLRNGDNRFRVTLSSAAAAESYVRLGWREASKKVFDPIPSDAFRHEPGKARTLAAHVQQGRDLFLELRCARCHLPPDARTAAPELGMDAPSFEAIGDRRRPQWMARWIENPSTSGKTARGAATMPKLLHGSQAQDEASAIAAYLSTLRGPTPPAVPPSADRTKLKARGAELFEKLHCVGCHAPLMVMLADDGRINIGDAGRRFQPGALVAYLRAPEKHYAWSRMPNFRLTEDEAQALAVLLNSDDRSVAPPVASQEIITRGRSLVSTKGCLSCHAAPAGLASSPSLFVDLQARPHAKGDAGCLADHGAPADYRLTAAEREALRAFIRAPEGLPSLRRHVPAEFVARQTRQLRCGACHGQLEGFPVVEVVGQRLRPEWTEAFIAGRVPYRPRPETHADGQVWLPARMPVFASRAPFLAGGLAAMHGLPPHTPVEPAVDAKLAKIGEALLSAHGGFSCVTCHAVGGSAATQVFETEGINLAYASERLLPEFARRWLLNPLKVDPHTKMPVYFDEDGKSPLASVLGGDASQQIEALWQYLRTVNPSSSARR